ncbi:type I-F CRISPR-associated protein Csy3 [Hydrogenovibrio halophilus]|uniref:type I-F CRISPR-associated protein Csy3 n=1 Tax=Hydrogenovibrio halophilus TaxID=373391 RepID=UPI00037D5252|nr:type I-F CRISPR-associated protein Csy3 [Hydrogenovibrio halophilus]
MKEPETFKKLPGVLSFKRGTIITDAVMLNEFDDGTTSPLMVVRHGIRGTQNVNKEGGKTNAKGESSDRDPSNIQQTDTAKMHPDSVAMRVNFDLSFLPLKETLFASSPGKELKPEEFKSFKKSLEEFIERACQSNGMKEIANRFARNILNGRWLWRNRTLASHVEITVLNGSEKLCSADALDIPLTSFENVNDEEKVLGRVIELALTGKNHMPKLRVSARVTFPVQGALEVYPSQNYLENKEKGFARPLYYLQTAVVTDEHGVSEKGQAAIRDQKIGNALRTFDTWYDDFDEIGRPIPVEPNGASLDIQDFMRPLSKKTSAFSYAKRLNEIDPDSKEGMFMIASLIRGGVYSEK